MTGTLVITGASAGIGLAAAGHFSDAGYQVVNLSRTAPELPEVQQVTADFADPDWLATSGEALDQALTDAAGRVVLVHCAGLLLKDSIPELAGADLARALQVNVVAAQQLNQRVLPLMVPGSAVIYVGSTLGEKAVAGAASYVTSKHAQIGLMRATCQDLIGTGIHTACVCPGFTDTKMLRAHVGEDESILEALASNVVMGRLIEPDEIAEAIFFAATHPVINGAVLHANLGQIER
ncbi:MAG: SDR family oxidoreductase [Pseudomonadota bacterium]